MCKKYEHQIFIIISRYTSFLSFFLIYFLFYHFYHQKIIKRTIIKNLIVEFDFQWKIGPIFGLELIDVSVVFELQLGLEPEYFSPALVAVQLLKLALSVLTDPVGRCE